MDPDNVLSKMTIYILVALVKNNKEQIKTRHDRSGHVDVSSESCLSVITTADRIRCSQDGCSGIQSCLNTSFCYRNSLLFHGFVNSHLIANIHLIKLINGTD